MKSFNPINHESIEKEDQLKLKLEYNHKNYYLNTFPKSITLLRKMITAKVDLKQNFEIYYFDMDNEKIQLSDDADLKFLIKQLINQQKSRFKVHIEPKMGENKIQHIQYLEEPLKSTIASLTALVSKSPAVDPKFKKILKEGDLPCQECLGEGTKEHKKCGNCYGIGRRPMNDHWMLVTKLIEFKVFDMILSPFKKLMMRVYQQDSGMREIIEEMDEEHIGSDENEDKIGVVYGTLCEINTQDSAYQEAGDMLKSEDLKGNSESLTLGSAMANIYQNSKILGV
jgi:hypothetical protein